VIIEMGWQPEKCNKGGLRNAVQSLSISASPAILMVDLSESGDPLNDINALAEVCEPGTVVIAVGQVNDVRLYRDLLASGIHDYLLKPLSASQLRDCLTQAQACSLAAQAHDAQSRQSATCRPRLARHRGGSGRAPSPRRCACAVQSREQAARPRCSISTSISGTGALALDLEPGRGPDRRDRQPSRLSTGLFIERR
jgi:pilus assembly protein CpaE